MGGGGRQRGLLAVLLAYKVVGYRARILLYEEKCSFLVLSWFLANLVRRLHKPSRWSVFSPLHYELFFYQCINSKHLLGYYSKKSLIKMCSSSIIYFVKSSTQAIVSYLALIHNFITKKGRKTSAHIEVLSISCSSTPSLSLII